MRKYLFLLLRNKTASFRFCFVIIYLSANATPIYAQNIHNLNIEKVQADGLSNNLINCITQDKNGFLWFGTYEGLFRYDGYTFKAFVHFPGDSTTLINNRINWLCPEKNYLWVASIGGLSRIDIDSQTIKNFPGPGSFPVSAILPKNDSVFWVGTFSGLFQFNKKNGEWNRVPVIDKNLLISSICDDKNGHLYITTSNGFYCYTKSTGMCKHYNPGFPAFRKKYKMSVVNYSRSILDRDGNIWMSTWNDGIVRFSPQSEKIKVWGVANDDIHIIPYGIAFDLLQDENGNIWIANKEGGLSIFDPIKNGFVNYPVNAESEDKLTGAVRSLFRDKSGTFWIGTENGIYKYDPHSVHLSKENIWVKSGNSRVQWQVSPLRMLKYGTGKWWVGDYTGLFIFDEKTGILKDRNKALGIPKLSPVFNIIRDSNGAIWFSVKNTLVKIFQKAGAENTPRHVEIFKSPDIQSNIYSLYFDRENRIWIGTTSSGIFRFDQGSKKFISYHYHEIGPKNKINTIRAFCELSKDSLLIGGERPGLFLLHTDNGRYEKIHWKKTEGKLEVSPPTNVIYKTGGNIWIGTEYNGLWETDSHLKTPIATTINDGLPSMEVNSITSDKYNNLWLLTNAGIVRFQIFTKKITVFDKKIGIGDLNVLRSIKTDNDGTISIGGRGCIYHLDPDSILKNIAPPKVFITGFKIFDKDYHIRQGQTITLKHNQNYFSLDYVALNFTQSNLNKYAYKMDGLDEQWNEAGARRYVSYANLDEGTYTFNVKACNNEGIWNDIPAKLIIIIKPPFWHRVWFYLLSAAVLLSILYAAFAYYINQLKIRIRLRDKIARDFHDELGSTLSSISLYSEMAITDDFEDKQRTKSILSLIGESSRSTVSAMQDMIWAIQPKNDNMQEVVYRMREYAYPLAELKDITISLDVDEDVKKLVLSMEVRKNIYLIFKEALNNAFKYAAASHITINMTKGHHVLRLEIKDDGKGFDLCDAKAGNGIRNMQKRAEQARGKLSVISSSGSGTEILFSCPIS